MSWYSDMWKQASIPGMTAKSGVPTANVGAEDQMRILQQMKMAEMLREQGATPLPQGSGMVRSGGGGQWAAPDQAYSTFGESLGKLGSSLAGGYMQKTANDEAKAYADALKKQQADDTARIIGVFNGSQGTPAVYGTDTPNNPLYPNTPQNTQQEVQPQQPQLTPDGSPMIAPNFNQQPQPTQDGQALGGMLKQGINGIDQNGQAMPTAPSPDISGGVNVNMQDLASALQPKQPTTQDIVTPAKEAVAPGDRKAIASALMGSTDPTRQTEGFKILMEATKPEELKSFDPTHNLYQGEKLISAGIPKAKELTEFEQLVKDSQSTDPILAKAANDKLNAAGITHADAVAHQKFMENIATQGLNLQSQNAQQKRDDIDSSKFGPDEISQAANRKLFFGEDLKYSGAANNINRAETAKGVEKLRTALGLTQAEAAALPYDNKTKLKAMGTLQVKATGLEASSMKIEKDIQVMENQLKIAGNNSPQILNQPLNYIKTKFSDPAQGALYQSIYTVAMEYAKSVNGGAMSISQLHSGAAKDAEHMLNGTMSINEILEKLPVMRADMANGRESNNAILGQLKGSLTNIGNPPPENKPKITPSDNEAIAWARANPKNPKSAIILKTNGVQP